MRRRGSVDNGIGRVCGAYAALAPYKPPRKGVKSKDDSKHTWKEEAVRPRRLSRSLKGEKDRNQKHGHYEEEEEGEEEEELRCIGERKSSLNRSLSFSSVDDYEANRVMATFEPLRHHASMSGSKWIVYGYF
jgi:hypothetical protein